MSTLVSLWLQDYSWYIGILCRFCMGDWSEAESGESFWGVSRQGGHRSSSNILIDKSLATYKMLSLAFDWTISFSWLMWPKEPEMFSLSSRQSRYWVLLPLHQVTTHLPSCELTYLTKHGYLLLPCFIHASSMLRCQVNYLGPCIRFPGAATQWSVEVCLRLQLNGPILLCICTCDLPFNYPLELN